MLFGSTPALCADPVDCESERDSSVDAARATGGPSGLLGFDTAVSVNEETKDARKTPGRAAVIATFVLLAVYVLVTTATQAFAGIGTTGIGLGNSDNASEVFSVLGRSVFGSSAVGSFAAHLLVLMVLSSAAASTLTTILPTARTTLSMAVHRAIPERFARVSSMFMTPTWSTVVASSRSWAG